MKMYILIKEDVEPGYAVLAAAHASLACYLKFKDDKRVVDWISGKFYKVIAKVNEKEFNNAKDCEDHVIITESKMKHMEVAIAFKPRVDWPYWFKYLRLYD